VRHLDALATVAEERSISRAAERLGYTQSAVSQQIRALERIVGVDVLARSPGSRSVALTDAGSRLLRHAEGIRVRVGNARRDLDELAATAAGTVRLGAIPSAARVLVPPVVAALREQAPEIVLHVEESHLPGLLLERLALATLDLVLAPVDDGAGDGKAVLLDDPYVLLVPPGDPLLALDRPVVADDLRDRDLVAKDCGTPSQRNLDAALLRLGIRTRIVVRANDGATIHELVARGVGIAIMPRLLAYGAADAAMLPLEGILPARRIGLHEANGPAVDARVALVAALFASNARSR
jgi:DNA-binding transcriptional LysR family regulator